MKRSDWPAEWAGAGLLAVLLAGLMLARARSATGRDALDAFPLPETAESVLAQRIRAGDLMDVTRMVEAEPQLLQQAIGPDGMAVHLAILRRQDAIAMSLIRHGADPDSRGRWNATPLQLAAWMGEADVVQLLLSSGVSAEQRGGRGAMVPILWAAAGSRVQRNPTADHVAVVKLLLAHGAQPDARDRLGRPASALASSAVAELLDPDGRSSGSGPAGNHNADRTPDRQHPAPDRTPPPWQLLPRGSYSV